MPKQERGFTQIALRLTLAAKKRLATDTAWWLDRLGPPACSSSSAATIAAAATAAWVGSGSSSWDWAIGSLVYGHGSLSPRKGALVIKFGMEKKVKKEVC